ncbi:MAG: acetyl-coenzyme A synthetase N-terminal domain-containing protein, partial [Alphaproteobacteria bacterium]
MTSRYPEIYRRSLAEPEAFWAEAAEAMHWYKRWDRVLDSSRAPYFYRWYAGAECNTCHNALDRHVAAGRGEQAALIYDSPMTGIVRAISYRELLDEVARFAGALAAEGVTKGDRVIIYMPMIPEA